MSMHLFGSDAQHNGAVDLPTVSQYMAQRPNVENWLTRLSTFAQDEDLSFEQKIEKASLGHFCEEFEQFAQEEQSMLHMLTVHKPLDYKLKDSKPSWKLMIAILCHTNQDLNKSFNPCEKLNDRLCLFSSPLQAAIISGRSKELVELCLVNGSDAKQPFTMEAGDAMGQTQYFFTNPKKQAQVIKLLLEHGYALPDHVSRDQLNSWIEERVAIDDAHAEATAKLQEALVKRDLAQVKEALDQGAKPNLVNHSIWGDAMEMANSFKATDRLQVEQLLRDHGLQQK